MPFPGFSLNVVVSLTDMDEAPIPVSVPEAVMDTGLGISPNHANGQW